MNDDIDPVDEVRAVREAIQEKYKTLDAYMAHMKEIPSADELLRQVRQRMKNTSHPTAGKPVKHQKAAKRLTHA